MDLDQEGLAIFNVATCRLLRAQRHVVDSLESRRLLSATVQLPLVNSDFQTLYKPGSTTITATLPVGATTEGFGSNFQVESLGTLQPVRVAYSDGTFGTSVDVPGWTTLPVQMVSHQQPAAGVVRDPSGYPGKTDNFASIFFAPTPDSLSTQIRQTLVGTTILPNSTYVLSADVGEAGRITLFAGATLIAPRKVGRTATAPDGFQHIVKTYVTGNSPPAGDLSAALGTAGITEYGDFDNISLTVTSSGTPTAVPLPFGNVNGRQKVVQLTQADGTIVTFAMTGGSGVATQDGGQVDLQITDMGKGANVNINATQGSTSFTLGNVSVSGTLNRLFAPQANLGGSISVSGSIGATTLNAISGQISASSIGRITAGTLTGEIYSAAGIDVLKLGAVSGSIDAAGNIGSLSATSIPGGTVLAGANLGASGATLVPPSSALSYEAATIGTISVAGSITGASFIGAGVSPTDGIFGNGNDTLAGTPSAINSVSIRGAVNPSARLEAGVFSLVRIGGKRINDLTSLPEFVVL